MARPTVSFKASDPRASAVMHNGIYPNYLQHEYITLIHTYIHTCINACIHVRVLGVCVCYAYAVTVRIRIRTRIKAQG